MSSNVRVRFAPSPTGYLHVGGARTALYDYLFAKSKGGKFILRVEDTDQERSTEEAMEKQLQDLKWLGLKWDEGPGVGGEYGPYRQSERLDIYKKYANQLLESGHAYYCFLTDDEIEKQRQENKNEGQFHIQSPYRNMGLDEAKQKINSGESAVVRFKVAERKTDYIFNDLVRGEVKFPSDVVGDFVLLRSGGMPVYNFCCVIDDALMKITHVLRAEEHLNNTLRQMMVYEALGFELPQFGHVSIILGPDKQKLSKRHGATSIDQYREAGYLPEAINNYLALLGWNDSTDKEIYSMDELVKVFPQGKLNPSPAVFDEEKLRWMNAYHLRDMDHDKLWALLNPVLDEAGIKLPDDYDWRETAITLFKSYMEVLNDAVELFRPLSLGDLNFTDEGRDCLSWDTSYSVVSQWKELISAESGEFLTAEKFAEIQNQVKVACDVKGKQLFMPIRTAVIGKPHGADLQTLIPLLSKQELLKRADQALNL